MASLPKNAITFLPTTLGKIDFASAMLKNDGFAQIPAKYAEFLTQSNGLIVNDVEFYGTEPAQRKSYIFPSIAQVNQALLENEVAEAAGNLQIGSTISSIIIYEPQTDSFSIKSRLSFVEESRFATVEELLNNLIKQT